MESSFFDKIKDEKTILCRKDNLYKSFAGPFQSKDLARDYINYIEIDDAFIINTKLKQFENCEDR